MVSLSKQFGRLIEDKGEAITPKSSILLRFETLAEHPLMMGELSYFFDENRDFLEGRNIEWCSDCATNLGDKVLITLSFELTN